MSRGSFKLSRLIPYLEDRAMRRCAKCGEGLECYEGDWYCPACTAYTLPPTFAVAYDGKRSRMVRTFRSIHAARRFYTRMAQAGRRPLVTTTPF
jgi:hypothetical protein